MTTPTATLGVVDDLPGEEYHASDALSSTGARLLVGPAGPARYHWNRTHPEPYKSHYDRGSAAHLLVLNAGPRLAIVEAGDWRTKAAKEQRDEARAAGAVPLLRHAYDDVRAMAAELANHPLAGPLLRPGSGTAEQSLFWTDPATGVPCRARIDWRTQERSGRTVIVEYKTCTSAAPDVLPRTVHNYGYHQQGMHYLDGAQHLGLADDDAAFLLVFQETTAPYLVSVRYLDAAAARIGRRRNHRARQIWAECTAAGAWPGYPTEALPLSLPIWAENEED